MRVHHIGLTAAALAALGVAMTTAAAQTPDEAVANFYRGKQMRFLIRSAPGGSYDIYSRLTARFIVNHIPGDPTIIAQNMPGAGGLTAINYIADIAPKDGTYITLISSSLVLDQSLDLTPTLKADLRTFGWIGNLNDSNVLTYVWHESRIKTFEDARRTETLLGSTGAGDISSWVPEVYNRVLGAKFKIIEGYRSGPEVRLAMQRREIDGNGSSPLSGLTAVEPAWLREKKYSVLVQIGVRREPLLPDAPLPHELARNDEEREIMGFIEKAIGTGRPIGVGPGVPKERVAALRKAFDEMLVDPDFIAAARKESADIGPMSGATVQQLIADVLGSPPELRAKVKAIMPAR
jgi:tripartite-type tricarboxylate transporter receptor subunit TctC